MTSFQSRCMTFLNRYASVHLLDRTGRRVRPDCLRWLRGMRGHIQPSVGLAVAMLADPPWPGRTSASSVEPPHPAADGLRRLALALMDIWSGDLIKHCSRPSFPPNFEMVALAPAFDLLAPHAGAARVRRWRRALLACARTSEQFLLAKRSAWGRPGPHTGCGPNHLFLICGLMFRIGRSLGEARFTRLARRAMLRLCELQADEGYFPEHNGPAVRYHRVSLFGVCEYQAASGDDFVAPFIRRGVRFVVRAMYPDLSPIETIDQRNRAAQRFGQVGQELGHWDLCFGRTPLGRRLAELTLARLAERLDRRPGEVGVAAAGMAAMAAVMDPGGRAARILPCERAAYTDRLDRQGGIVRRDGWCLALSAYHRCDRPGNPFILDRTQNLSVFNDRFGLIVGGGNDKFRLDAATFEIVESGYVRYFPPLGGTVRLSARRGTLEMDYGAARARLVGEVRSRRQVELTAGVVTNFAYQVNRFNLQIPVGPGTTVKIDGRPVRLHARRKAGAGWPVRRRLELPGGVRIEPLGGAEFCWPHLPHNSYGGPTYAGGIDMAVAFLRLPLSGSNLAERKVRITVR